MREQSPTGVKRSLRKILLRLEKRKVNGRGGEGQMGRKQLTSSQFIVSHSPLLNEVGGQIVESGVETGWN